MNLAYMKISIRFSIVIFCLTGMLTSCEQSNDVNSNNNYQFKNGVFVVDEGNFSDADGEVTFINFTNSDIRHNVFQSANGRPFAGLLQSMTIYNGKGYLVDQLGRLEVVDPITFKSEGSITSGLTLPRYFAAGGNDGYITDWGPYDASYNNNNSEIIHIDLNNLTVLESHETLSRPEGIAVTGDRILVANSATNYITVYSTGTLTFVKQIEVAYGPSLFVNDKYGDLWVVCTGTDSTRSTITRIDVNSLTVLSVLTMPEGLHLNGRIAINGTGDILYVMSESWSTDFSYSTNNIFKQPVDGNSFSYTSLISGQNFYGLGVDPVNNNIYVSDTRNFQTEGIIYAYSDSGSILDSAQVDRGPRDFVFVEEP